MKNKNFNFKYILNRVITQKRPVRFLLSRILWLIGLCRIFKIDFLHEIKIRFYPTSTSTALWVDPNCFNSEGVNFIWDYLLPGDTFVDVGANIGHLTLVGAKKVGCNGHVLSIEPHPIIFKFLKGNIKLNNFKNVETYNFAAGNKTDKSTFSNIRSDDQNFIGSGESILVDIKKLDDLPIKGKIDLLKVDVEGYELFVFRGAINTLSKTTTIHFEIYETNFRRYNYKLKDVLDFFIKNDFKIFKFVTENRLKEINSGYTTKECENLLAVKDVSFLKERIKNLTFDFLNNN